VLHLLLPELLYNRDAVIFFVELVFLAEWWAGCDIIIYIDRDDFDKFYGKEHGYLIMNHAYDIDWLMGWIFCDRIKLLGVSLIDLHMKKWAIEGVFLFLELQNIRQESSAVHPNYGMGLEVWRKRLP
jgi:hypothetical protein